MLAYATLFYYWCFILINKFMFISNRIEYTYWFKGNNLYTVCIHGKRVLLSFFPPNGVYSTWVLILQRFPVDMSYKKWSIWKKSWRYVWKCVKTWCKQSFYVTSWSLSRSILWELSQNWSIFIMFIYRETCLLFFFFQL